MVLPGWPTTLRAGQLPTLWFCGYIYIGLHKIKIMMSFLENSFHLLRNSYSSHFVRYMCNSLRMNGHSVPIVYFVYQIYYKEKTSSFIGLYFLFYFFQLISSKSNLISTIFLITVLICNWSHASNNFFLICFNYILIRINKL